MRIILILESDSLWEHIYIKDIIKWPGGGQFGSFSQLRWTKTTCPPCTKSREATSFPFMPIPDICTARSSLPLIVLLPPKKCDPFKQDSTSYLHAIISDHPQFSKDCLLQLRGPTKRVSYWWTLNTYWFHTKPKQLSPKSYSRLFLPCILCTQYIPFISPNLWILALMARIWLITNRRMVRCACVYMTWHLLIHPP